MRSERLVWCIRPEVVTAIRDVLGDGWTVTEVDAPAFSDGDGGRASPAAVAAARGAEVYFGYGIPAEVVAAGTPTLRWVHTGTAGVGGSVEHLRGTGLILTNSAGIHAEPMADWVLAAIAHFARGFDAIVRAQAAGRWIKANFGELRVPVRELAELRVGIVGVGGIGSAVARRAIALG